MLHDVLIWSVQTLKNPSGLTVIKPSTLSRYNKDKHKIIKPTVNSLCVLFSILYIYSGK